MISHVSNSERRQNPRLENNVPVKICQDGGDFVTETKNISRSGAYCRVDQFVAPMTKLKVHLLLTIPKGDKNISKKISCEGIVVRTVESEVPGHYNIAIFFNDIARRDAEVITDYVDAYLKNNGGFSGS